MQIYSEANLQRQQCTMQLLYFKKNKTVMTNNMVFKKCMCVCKGTPYSETSLNFTADIFDALKKCKT